MKMTTKGALVAIAVKAHRLIDSRRSDLREKGWKMLEALDPIIQASGYLPDQIVTEAYGRT